MRVSSSTSVRRATRCCVRKLATVACSARMEPCPVQQGTRANELDTARRRAICGRCWRHRGSVRRAVLRGRSHHPRCFGGDGVELSSDRRDPATGNRGCARDRALGVLALASRAPVVRSTSSRSRWIHRARSWRGVPARPDCESIHRSGSRDPARRCGDECATAAGVRCSDAGGTTEGVMVARSNRKRPRSQFAPGRVGCGSFAT